MTRAAARPQRSPPPARRPWYRWRFLHWETKTEIVLLPTLVLAKRRM